MPHRRGAAAHRQPVPRDSQTQAGEQSSWEDVVHPRELASRSNRWAQSSVRGLHRSLDLTAHPLPGTCPPTDSQRHRYGVCTRAQEAMAPRVPWACSKGRAWRPSLGRAGTLQGPHPELTAAAALLAAPEQGQAVALLSLSCSKLPAAAGFCWFRGPDSRNCASCLLPG